MTEGDKMRELIRNAVDDWIIRRGYSFDVERTQEQEEASWPMAEEIAAHYGISVLDVVWPIDAYTKWKCDQLGGAL
jgi:hypothetical protein